MTPAERKKIMTLPDSSVTVVDRTPFNGLQTDDELLQAMVGVQLTPRGCEYIEALIERMEEPWRASDVEQEIVRSHRTSFLPPKRWVWVNGVLTVIEEDYYQSLLRRGMLG